MEHADRFLRRFYIEKGMFGSLSLTFFFYRPPLPRSGGGPDPPEVTARERKRSQRQSISSGKSLFHYKFYELKNKKNFNEKFEHVEIANFF